MPFLRKHPALSFFVLTFAISWGALFAGRAFDLPALTFLGSFGPALSAFLLTAALAGRDGLLDLMQRIFRWRLPLRWYLVALLTPLLAVILASALLFRLGDPPIPPPDWLAIAPQLGLAILSLTLLGFPILLGEEIGWRGFAQPYLQTRFSPLGASLIIGVFWGAWHLPQLLWQGVAPLGIVYFVLETTLISLVYTWLYLETGGSLVVINLLHTFYDACGYSFIHVVPFGSESLLLLSMHVLAAGVAFFCVGPRRFLRSPAQSG